MNEIKRSSLQTRGVSIFNQNDPVPNAPSAAPAHASTQEKTAPKKPTRAPRQQVKFYADANVYESFKIAHRMHATNYDSLSDHLNHLLIRELEALSQEHNNGQPYGDS